MNSSRMHLIIFGSALFVLSVAVGFGLLGIKSSRIFHKNENVSCTTEAKQCPDGSSVGRVPPDCAFAKCPNRIQKQNQYEDRIEYPMDYPDPNVIPDTKKSPCPDDEYICPDERQTRVKRIPSTCEFEPCPGDQGSDQSGVWGGDHIRIDIGKDSSRVEFDCAYGSIEGFNSSKAGTFAYSGTYVSERGGPELLGQSELSSISVVYRGSISGNAMTLTIAKEESGEEIGLFSLTRGSLGLLEKCL